MAKYKAPTPTKFNFQVFTIVRPYLDGTLTSYTLKYKGKVIVAGLGSMNIANAIEKILQEDMRKHGN